VQLLVDSIAEAITRSAAASSAEIRAAFFPAELWYGAEIGLCPDDPAEPRLYATSLGDHVAGPGESVAMGLALEEAGVLYSLPDPLTREQAAAYFERFGAGDRSWIDALPWEELRDGSLTGRRRETAG
jgi:hypothetical protein